MKRYFDFDMNDYKDRKCNFHSHTVRCQHAVGEAVSYTHLDYKVETVSTGSSSQGTASNPYIDAQAEQEITFTYCTQFLIMLEHPFTENQETEFKSYLESIGDSIVVVADDEIVKVHVHTNDPGMAMQRGLTYGSLTTIIIENMRLELSLIHI